MYQGMQEELNASEYSLLKSTIDSKCQEFNVIHFIPTSFKLIYVTPSQ